MKVLIYGGGHHKIIKNLTASLQLNNCTVTQSNTNNFDQYDIVYSASALFKTSQYKNTKFIFGPQLGIIPSHVNIHNCDHALNAVFIQPSKWCVELWTKLGWNALPIKSYPVGIDTDLFKPANNRQNTILVYIKHRNPSDIDYALKFLATKHLEYEITIFRYGSYNESDYIKALQTCKFGVWLDAHESQGFATLEALSCDLPLLIWNVTSLKQEHNISWNKNLNDDAQNLATSIPYWNDNCGEVFYKKEELESTFERLTSRLDTYTPRQFILDNLSLKKQGKEFLELF